MDELHGAAAIRRGQGRYPIARVDRQQKVIAMASVHVPGVIYVRRAAYDGAGTGTRPITGTMRTMSDATPTSTSDLIGAVRREGDAVVIVVRGEVDLHNSPALRSEMLKQLGDPAVHRLVLNLGAVPYMDSSGIAVFVEALQKLRRVGGKVFLTDLQPRVKGLLEIARLDTIFTICTDEGAALK